MPTRVLLFLFAAASAVAIGACRADRVERVGERCGDAVVMGEVISASGLELSIHNDQGQAIAGGTQVTLNMSDGLGNFSPTPTLKDSATLEVFVVYPGTYSVSLSKPLYRDTTLNDVVIKASDCTTVNTTKLSVILHPASSNPVVRSVSIFGARFLEQPGAEAHLSASVDAVRGASRRVRWLIDDPSLANVDQSGTVIAKCTTRGGTATITARAISDTSVDGVARIAVAPGDSC